MNTLVFFDLETGGLELNHPIIQIAAVAVGSDWKELETFQRKIKFDPARCAADALEKNCYDEATWAAEAVPVLQAVSEFALFLNEYKTVEMLSKRTGNPYSVARLAGYNCATFDQPRLMALFAANKTFLPADPRTLDVFQLAMWHFEMNGNRPADYKLATVAAKLGFALEGAHEAMNDVRMTVKITKALIR